jgi:hypothetical protein
MWKLIAFVGFVVLAYLGYQAGLKSELTGDDEYWRIGLWFGAGAIGCLAFVLYGPKAKSSGKKKAKAGAAS